MSIATAIQNAQAKIADAYTACDAKGATMPQTQDLSNLANCIGSISSGGGGNPVAEENDVIFIDYDGTIRYSYSAADFANLTELPANPTHQGLTAQGWNWTLADAKAYVAAYGMLVIGQLYITDDGKTRVYINVGSDIRSRTVWWYQTAANSVTVDWGDGTVEDTVSGTGAKSASHTYASPGSYIIKFTCTSGEFTLGGGGTTTTFFGDNRTDATLASTGSLTVLRVELGSRAGLNTYTFTGYRNLQSITIPEHVTRIQTSALDRTAITGLVLGGRDTVVSGYNYLEGTLGYTPIRYFSTPKAANAIGYGSYQFRDCYHLRMVSLSPQTSTLYQGAFSNCYGLARISIPANIAAWSSVSIFYNCIALEKIEVPSGVTSIGNSAFQNCKSLRTVIMRPTTPPTIGAATFSGTVTDMVIYVPNGKLAAYQGASNWSAYASQMVEMPA